jgi:hypothetical protein
MHSPCVPVTFGLGKLLVIGISHSLNFHAVNKATSQASFLLPFCGVNHPGGRRGWI